MPSLSQSFIQHKIKNCHSPESELTVAVDFEPFDGAVWLNSVTVYNYERKTTTDITKIMENNFSEWVDEVIQDTDWRLIYRENFKQDEDLNEYETNHEYEIN